LYIVTANYANRYRGRAGKPIFLSNFVRFKCTNPTYDCYTSSKKRYIGIVTTIAKDYRSVATEIGTITLKIRYIALADVL